MEYTSEVLYIKTYADGVGMQFKYLNSTTKPVIVNNDVSSWKDEIPSLNEGERLYMIQKKSNEANWSAPIQMSAEDGITPTISIVETENGKYWAINGVLTTTKAEGEPGYSPDVKIGDNGNWFINGKDSGIKAQGITGTKTESVRVFYSKTSDTSTPDGPGPSDTPESTNVLDKWTTSEPTSSSSYKYTWSCTGVKTTTYNTDGSANTPTYSNWTTPELYKAYISDAVDPFATAEYYKLTDFEKKEAITYGTDGKLYLNATYINTGALTVKKGGNGVDKNSVVFSAGWGKDDNNNDIGVVNLAGWKVTSTTLQQGDNTPGDNKPSGDTWALTAGTGFGITNNGYLYATSGNIAGWKITKDCLSSEHTRFFGANRYRKKTYNNSYSPLRMMSSSGYLQKKTGSYSISINGNTENTQGVQPVTSSNQIIYCEIKSVPNGIELKDFYVNDNLLYCTIKNTTSSKITGTIEYYIEYLTSPSFYVLDDGFLRASSIQLGSGNLGSPDTAFLATTNLTGPNTFFPDENSQGRGNWRLAVGSLFGVTSDGSLYASAANISGTITANAGSIAGWEIDEGILVNYGTENENMLQGVFLFQNQDIQENTYALVIGDCLKNEDKVQWSDAGFKVGFSGNVYVKTMTIGYENDRYQGWTFTPDEIGWGSGWIRWEQGNITCNTITMMRAAVTNNYTDCDITNQGKTTGFKIRDNYSPQKAYFKIVFSPGVFGTSIYMYYCDSSYNEARPTSNCGTKLYIYSRRSGQGKDEGVMKEWNPSFTTSGGTATKTYYYDEFNCWIGADYLGYGFTEAEAVEMAWSETKKIDNSITDYIQGTVTAEAGIFGINVSYTHLVPSSAGGRSLNLGTDTNMWAKAYLKDTSHSSDRKLKKEVLTIPDAFNKKLILGLQPKSYKFINAETPRTRFGFIAQEVEELLISLGTSADELGIVNKSKPGEPDSEDNHYSLNYTCLLAPMVSMIQQQEKRISELETEIQNLKSV